MRSKSRVRRWLGALLFCLSLALVSLAPRKARARGFEEDVAIGVLLVGAVAVTDIVFTSYAAVVAANGELPSQGWAIAEVIVTAPQTLLLGGFTVGTTLGNEPEVSAAIVPFATWAGAMTTHGAWTLLSTHAEPSTLFFASPAIGANATLTLSAFAALFTERRLFMRPMGVAEVVLTLPQVVGSSIRLATDASHRPGWIALTAWSGALLLHGVASVAAGDETPEPAVASALPSSSERPYRRAALAPRIDGFGPAPIGYAVDRPPGLGLVLRGAF